MKGLDHRMFPEGLCCFYILPANYCCKQGMSLDQQPSLHYAFPSIHLPYNIFLSFYTSLHSSLQDSTPAVPPPGSPIGFSLLSKLLWQLNHLSPNWAFPYIEKVCVSSGWLGNGIKYSHFIPHYHPPFPHPMPYIVVSVILSCVTPGKILQYSRTWGDSGKKQDGTSIVGVLMVCPVHAKDFICFISPEAPMSSLRGRIEAGKGQVTQPS